jgi:ABC-type glycerol-3-phosphate transport system substrate-binding protein
MYRKKAVADAKVTIPVTWDDVCEQGAKLTKGPVIGFAVPLGANGGAGGRRRSPNTLAPRS